MAFEGMVIQVVNTCASVHAACELLNLDWKHVHAIMERAVQRGMERRRVGGLKIDQTWAFKELFAYFWGQPHKESAHIFIKKWCSRVKNTRPHALKKFAAMVERHLNGSLKYFVSCLTNALWKVFTAKSNKSKPPRVALDLSRTTARASSSSSGTSTSPSRSATKFSVEP
jgi:hypothetical protein